MSFKMCNFLQIFIPNIPKSHSEALWDYSIYKNILVLLQWWKDSRHQENNEKDFHSVQIHTEGSKASEVNNETEYGLLWEHQ